MFLARIRVSGEVAGLLLAIGAPLLAVGIVYGVLDSLRNMILRNLSEEERKKHILSKITNALALIVFLAVLLLFSLPGFGITPLGNPFNI